MARADRRRAARQARTTRDVRTSGGARVAVEHDMFFPKLRKQAKWMFVFLALVFGLGFVLFGVGTGSGGLTDLLQGNWSLFGGSSDPTKQQEEDARERIEKNRNDAQAYRELAAALAAQDKFEEAIRAQERYRTLRPRDVDGLTELAALYERQAEAAGVRANEIQSQGVGSFGTEVFLPDQSTDLGQALAGSADPQAGFDPVNRAVQTEVNERANAEYRKLQEAANNAVSAYERVTEVTPRDPNAWAQLARGAEGAGDIPKAISAYERFLELAPDDPLAPAVRDRLAQLRQARPAASGAG